MDRRTVRYSAAIRLIELLKHGQSVTWEDGHDRQSVSLPGFAFDMSRIWQRLLGRVLGEWDTGVQVREEFSLRGVFRSNPGYPFRGEVPTPRPDFAVFRHGKLIGFFDAKYRDLSEHSLPRDMLYQLAIYAMAQGGGVATILYATDSRSATEERLDISDPVTASVRAAVGLRPVNLEELEALITAPPSDQRANARLRFAESLVSR
jgi:5-methylcytosine-specific restriction enzyme subunit McrC